MNLTFDCFYFRVKKWLAIIAKQDLSEEFDRVGLEATRNKVICSKHFECRMYNNPKDRAGSRLLPLAFPTLGRDFSTDTSAASMSLFQSIPTLTSGNLSNNEQEATTQQTVPCSNSNVQAADTSMLSIPIPVSADLSSIKQEESIHLSPPCSISDTDAAGTSLSSIPIPMSADLPDASRDEPVQLSIPGSTSDTDATDTAVSSIPIPLPMSEDLSDASRDESVQLLPGSTSDADATDTVVSSIPIPMSANFLNTNLEEPMELLKGM